MEEALSTRLFWLYNIIKSFFRTSRGIPHIILAAVDLYFSHSLLFLPCCFSILYHFWLFIPLRMLKYRLISSLISSHFSLSFFLSLRKLLQLLVRTFVGLFKAVLEVKSPRQFQLLKPGLSFISYFSSFLCVLSSIEKGAEESDLLPAHVLEDTVCLQVCFFLNVGNKCSWI